MKLSPQVLALLALSLSATNLAGGCAEDGSDAAPPPEVSDPDQDLAPLTEADDDGEETPTADAGTKRAPAADAGQPSKKDPKPRSEPCPACGLG